MPGRGSSISEAGGRKQHAAGHCKPCSLADAQSRRQRVVRDEDRGEPEARLSRTYALYETKRIDQRKNRLNYAC